MESIKSGRKDIVETAIANGSFKTFAAALQAADLVQTLKGRGPFTVFAPTDEAFAKIPKAKLDDLLKPENKAKLTKLLTYHVVNGTRKAAGLKKATALVTVQGTDLEVAFEDHKARVGKGHVTKVDVECSNGVIHVIDTVAVPKRSTARAVPDGALPL